jgi:hypothetical protein
MEENPTKYFYQMEENPKKLSIRWKRILRRFLSDGRESYEIFLPDERVSQEAFYQMEENPKKLSIRWKRILRSFLSDGRES